MLRSYLTTAIRNMMRKKRYTFINVFGLGLGLACCILMTLFVKHEWSRDQFHEKREQLFRLVMQREQPDGQVIPMNIWDTMFPLSLVNDLKNDIPSVVQACAFMRTVGSGYGSKITMGAKTFDQTIGIVSANFFDVFTFPLLAGNPKTALDHPDGMVIAQTTAHKFFGDVPDYAALIGQVLTVNKSQPNQFVVTGVMADVPTTSSLQFDVLVSTKAEKGFALARGHRGVRAWVYVQTTATTAARVLEALDHWPKKEKLREEISYENKPFNFVLQPLMDVYWNTAIPNHYGPQGNPTGGYILGGLAWLILLIACSNFISLSVAESSDRAMEVGLRKVMGAKREQIIVQFWIETLLMSFLSLFLGASFAEVLLPVFNEFVHQKLTFAYFEDGWILLVLLGSVGLIAGSYPAWVLSRFQPVSAMKGEARIGGRNLLTRILIILQYAASIALIISAGVMIQQRDYVQNKNLGFNKSHVAIVQATRQTVRPYKQAIANDVRVAGVAVTDRPFTGFYSRRHHNLPDGREIVFGVIGIDVDYLATLEISLLDGRDFSKDRPADLTKAIVINETMAKQLGIENPVGKTLTGFVWNAGNSRQGVKDPTIIGVVRDFHLDSLHKQIMPLALVLEKYTTAPSVLVRIRPGHMVETIEMLKSTWKRVVPNEPFELEFLDERLNRQYANEVYWFRVLIYSALMAVVLSCLGLFGLASLSVARRTKEIGIRRALGASVSQVMWLLSKNFIKLPLVANVIAWPVAYWMMDKWLTNFAYRIDLGAGVFVIAGILTLLVALLTVNIQTLKDARCNPVDALRYE